MLYINNLKRLIYNAEKISKYGLLFILFVWNLRLFLKKIRVFRLKEMTHIVLIYGKI